MVPQPIQMELESLKSRAYTYKKIYTRTIDCECDSNLNKVIIGHFKLQWRCCCCCSCHRSPLEARATVSHCPASIVFQYDLVLPTITYSHKFISLYPFVGRFDTSITFFFFVSFFGLQANPPRPSIYIQHHHPALAKFRWLFFPKHTPYYNYSPYN